jgi:transcriptional regulator with XRE-family HTH domain
MINISEKISSLRKAHNLTQEALGEAVGVSPQAVSKWEKGDSLPDISVIPGICRTFGISADVLLGNETNMTAEMYVEKALDLCKENSSEKINLQTRLLHKIMAKGDKESFASNLSDAHVFSIIDGRGFGLLFSEIEYIKNIMSVNLTENKLLKFISDEKAIKIFILICINGMLNENEITKITGFSEQEVTEKLFAFMKYNVIQSVMDAESNSNEMAYAIDESGILLLGIIASAFLFDSCSRKSLKSSSHAKNSYPDKLRKFMD